MTPEEIKQKIADLKEAIANSDPKSEAENIELYEKGIAKYQSMLTDSKDEPEGASHNNEPTGESIDKGTSKKAKAKAKQKKIKAKAKPKPERKPTKTIITKPKKLVASKDEPGGASHETKNLEIQKGEKKEIHRIDTAFGKDIKDAILVLNKERFAIREIKDKKTGTIDKVKHSPEYRNAKTIQKRVNEIFESSVYDIAPSKKDKAEKKDIIEVVNEIKDLHTLWLNEVDMIINNEVKADLEAIKNLMLHLIKEAKKNDGDDKWKTAGGLSEIAKKYNL